VRIKRYEGAEANKTNFLGSCNTRSLAHVASHCVLNNDDPDFNFIAFAGIKPGSQEQGLLFLNDLYAQPLNLDFLGFSACETSKGQYVSGEGNMSMARGLTSAGVKSFVTTLWPVYSDNNATIFPRFYKDLKAGVPKDVALAEAKRAFALGYGRSPYDWGGLVLIGDAGAISLQDYRTESPIFWWLLAGLVVLVAGIFVFFQLPKRVI
jgi:CHAT domain-containing protein